MPFEHSWLVPHRICIVRYNGILSIEDVRAVVNIAEQYIAQAGTNPVHFIHDHTRTEKVNIRLKEAVEAMRLMLGTPRVGWNISVNPASNMMEHFVTTVVNQVTGVRNQRVDTLEEALEFLCEMDDGVNTALKHLKAG